MRYALICAAALSLGGVLSMGCSHEVSHTEKDKPALLGGHVHEETTTYQNPDGTQTTEHEKEKTSD